MSCARQKGRECTICERGYYVYPEDYEEPTPPVSDLETEDSDEDEDEEDEETLRVRELDSDDYEDEEDY